jgi:Arc/MetJ-type ribon-helix-helix transcriptional regulator
MSKQRMTVTIDEALLRAGQDAVAEGRAESLSAWVNQALADRVAHEQRLTAMADAVAAYESEHGPITDAEIARQQRTDRARAIVLRGGREGVG